MADWQEYGIRRAPGGATIVISDALCFQNNGNLTGKGSINYISTAVYLRLYSSGGEQLCSTHGTGYTGEVATLRLVKALSVRSSLWMLFAPWVWSAGDPAYRWI